MIQTDTLKKYMYLTLIHLLNCLPLKQQKILFFSYYGSQYGGNPKYISQYLTSSYPTDSFDVVWAFNHPGSRRLSGVRQVRFMSLRYFYELCTSKVIITDFRSTELFIKRKQQYYIQTWHSSLRLKQIENDIVEMLPATYVKMAKQDSRQCDLLLSGCRYSSEIFRRAFWYSGEIFEQGTPRNDILVQNNRSQKSAIRQKLDIDEHINVLLYAPTFRKDHDLAVYDLDYNRLADDFTRKFGGEWLILVKFHPHLMNKAHTIASGKRVMNVTSYDDSQELLLIADVLISDYSALMFDFAITQRPCFLYTPDIETYLQTERKLYFDINALPFPSTRTQDQLSEAIDRYNQGIYQARLHVFLSEIGSFEDGQATKQTAQRLEQICLPTKTRSEWDEAI